MTSCLGDTSHVSRKQKPYALAQIRLIMHHYPNMDEETRARANKTLNQLKEMYNLHL